MKLILFPLVVLTLISLLAMTGLGTSFVSEQQAIYAFAGGTKDSLLYDAEGNIICYGNGTAYYATDTGHIWVTDLAGTDLLDFTGTTLDFPMWTNNTDDYLLFNNPYGEINTIALGNSFSLTTTLGIIGIIALIIGAVSLVGFTFLGSGLAEISVKSIILVTALITIWGVFSWTSINLFADIPFALGGIFYFFLTMLYTVGIIQQIGGSGDA